MQEKSAALQAGGSPRKVAALLVAGMHRSGTSAITRVMALLGANLPENLLQPGSDNPTGFWEPKSLVAVNEKVLADLGTSWDDPLSFLIRREAVAADERVLLRMQCAIATEFGAASTVVAKDPRLGILLDPWLIAFMRSDYAPCVVVPIRDPLEVAASLSARNGIAVGRSLQLWLGHLLAVERSSRGFPRIFVGYSDLLQDWRAAMRRTEAKLDVQFARWSPAAEFEIDKFLSNSARNHVSAEAVLMERSDVSGWVKEAFQWVIKAAHDPVEPPSDVLDEVVEGYSSSLRLHAPLFIEQRASILALDHLVSTLRNECDSSKRDADGQSSLIVELERRLEDQTQATALVQQSLGDRLSSIDTLQRQLELKSGNINKLQQQLEDSRLRVQALQNKAVFLSNDLSVFRQQLLEARSRAEELGEANERLELDAAEVQRRLEEAQQQLDRALADLARLQEIAENQEAATGAMLSATHLAYQRSTSWRLTAPIRLIGATQRRVISLLKSVPTVIAVSGGPAKAVGRAVGIYRREGVSGLARRVNRLTTGVSEAEAPGPNRSEGQSSPGVIGPLDHPDNCAAINDLREGRQRTCLSRWHVSYVRQQGVEADVPEIDVVGVIYNNTQYLDEFLHSLIEGSFPARKINLFLVDNGSNALHSRRLEVQRDFLERAFGNFNILRGENVGYGSGCDAAIRRTRADLVLISNIDIRFDPTSIETAVATAINDAADTACWEFRQRPYEHPKYYDPRTLLTNWCSHAAVLMRRTAYESSGGYEKAIFMYGEDVELSYRLRGQGWKLRYLPNATVYHHLTFDDAKAHQLSGSLAASVLLRDRFWSQQAGDDLLAHITQRMRLEGDGIRREAFQTAVDTVERLRPQFSPLDQCSGARFPFHGFDYELRRDGAEIAVSGSLHNVKRPPMVSIITRTIGKRLGLLEEAILSVLNQTYVNIEHLVIEDGGESAKDIVCAIQRGYGGNLKYISVPKMGRSAAGNAGFSMASGQYLMMLDDDDLLFSDHVELLAETLHREISAVAAYSLAWAVESEFTGNAHYYERSFFTPEQYKRPFDAERLKVENFMPIQSVLFRRSAYLTLGGFHEGLDSLEDWNLWHRYSLLGAFKFIPKTTSMYRIPAVKAEMEERQAQLDAWYKAARRQNREDRQAAFQHLSSPHHP